jgi:riboflavin synthase
MLPDRGRLRRRRDPVRRPRGDPPAYEPALGRPRVNLERSLRADSRLGGHFVTGHIDGRGTIEAFEPRGPDHYLRIRGPEGCGRLLIVKGSIAVDGISLTVAEVDGDAFAVWIIPHTLAVTNLRIRGAGDLVNLEFDMLGKYVEKLLAQRVGAA